MSTVYRSKVKQIGQSLMKHLTRTIFKCTSLIHKTNYRLSGKSNVANPHQQRDINSLNQQTIVISMYKCPRCQQCFDTVSDDVNNNEISDCINECGSFDAIDGCTSNVIVVHGPISRRRRLQHVVSKSCYLYVSDDAKVDCRQLKDGDKRFVLTVTNSLCLNNILLTTFQASESGRYICATVDGSSGMLVLENGSSSTDEDHRFFYQTKTRRDKTRSYFRPVCFDEFYLAFEDERLLLKRIDEKDIEWHFEAHFTFTTGK